MRCERLKVVEAILNLVLKAADTQALVTVSFSSSLQITASELQGSYNFSLQMEATAFQTS